VRAMAAAQAADETSAFDGLVTGTAQRWLSNASGEEWKSAATAALTRLLAPPEGPDT
jgi:hypothetical protein